MLRMLIITGAVLGTWATSAAAEDWYVLRTGAGMEAENPDSPCFAVPRTAEAGEEQVGGPYASEAEAEKAMTELAGCTDVPLKRGG